MDISVSVSGLMQEQSCIKIRNDKGKKNKPEHFPPLLEFHLNLHPDLNFKLPKNLRYLNHPIIYLTFLPRVINKTKGMLMMCRGPSWK